MTPHVEDAVVVGLGDLAEVFVREFERYVKQVHRPELIVGARARRAA